MPEEQNPIVVTPTTPPTRAPVVGQGPVTDNPPTNLAMGVAAAATINYGTNWVAAGDPVPNAVALFLNTVVMQPLKRVFPLFRHAEAAVLVMFIVAFGVVYFIVYKGDEAKAFYDAALSTFQAVANYKADKASGLNILKPAEDS